MGDVRMMHASMTAIAAVVVVLMSSCSWVQRHLTRHGRAQAKLHARQAGQAILPTAQQQEEAKKLLALRNSKEDGKQAGEKAEESVASGEGRIHRDPVRVQWRGTHREPALWDVPQEQDPAERQGLRSPGLPKLLPMDMDGRIQTTGEL